MQSEENKMREYLKYLIDQITNKDMLAYLILKAAKAIKAQEE